MSAGDGLRLECVSSQAEEGVITGREGNTIPLGDTGVWRLTNPFRRPGVLRLLTHYAQLSPITTADQGIHTCTLPDGNGGQVVINVGLYPSGFNGELNVHVHALCVGVVWDEIILLSSLLAVTGRPIITDLTYNESGHTLTCVSTVSPATTVSWMKDGQPLTPDGSSYYTLTQTVTDRTTSTYSNVLTVSEGTAVAGNYICTVTNDLGSDSKIRVALGKLIHFTLSCDCHVLLTCRCHIIWS